MNHFDETSRFACKLDGGGFLAWVCRRLDPPPTLAFDRWDDARRVSPPGWPDRADDLVAVLRPDGDGPPTWLLVESESEPERFIFHRLGVYALLLSMELSRGTAAGSEPPVGCVLLNLTGQPRQSGLSVAVAGTKCGQTVTPLVINFRAEDAAATLEEIAAGTTAPVLLPWVPLMAGCTPALIERWKEVALVQKDASVRALYRDLALVFAELSKGLIDWQKGLEGFEMLQSTVIQGWMDQGIQRGALDKARADLLRVIRLKLQNPVPEDIRQAIDGTNDEAVLGRWLDAAVLAADLPAFIKEMRR